MKNEITDEKSFKIGNVIVTDMNNLVPTVYEADKFYKFHRMTMKMMKASKIIK